MAPTMAILGSTGSIGRQTFDVCRFLGVRVVALTAHSSAELKAFLPETPMHFAMIKSMTGTKTAAPNAPKISLNV